MTDDGLKFLAIWVSVGIAVSVGFYVTENPVCLLGFAFAFLGSFFI